MSEPDAANDLEAQLRRGLLGSGTFVWPDGAEGEMPVRGSFLARAIRDAATSADAPSRGSLQAESGNHHILGTVDLAGLVAPDYRLELSGLNLSELLLGSAELRSVEIEKGEVSRGLDLIEARVRSVFLKNLPLRVLYLMGADIGIVHLDAVKVSGENVKGPEASTEFAIAADRLTCDRWFLLVDVVCTGSVRLSGAKLHHLVVTGGEYESFVANAVTCDGPFQIGASSKRDYGSSKEMPGQESNDESTNETRPAPRFNREVHIRDAKCGSGMDLSLRMKSSTKGNPFGRLHVDLSRTQVVGTLQLRNSVVGGRLHETLLRIDGIQCDNDLVLRDVTVDGRTSLRGARVSGDLLVDSRCRFYNVGFEAISFEFCRVGGQFEWGHPVPVPAELAAKSKVNPRNGLRGGEKTGGFERRREVWELSGRMVAGGVNLDWAHANVYKDSVESWPPKGCLSINGFTYGRIHPMDGAERARWLDRRPRRPYRAQPYEQLAKALMEAGEIADWGRVLRMQHRDWHRFRRRRPRPEPVEWPSSELPSRSKGGSSSGEDSSRLRKWAAWLRLEGTASFRRAVARIRWIVVGICFGWTAGYGFSPWRATLWALGIGLILWNVFSWAASQGLFVSTTTGEVIPAHSMPVSWYWIDAFVPFVDFKTLDAFAPRVSGPSVGCGLHLRNLLFTPRNCHGWYLSWAIRLQIALGWGYTSLLAVAIARRLRAR